MTRKCVSGRFPECEGSGTDVPFYIELGGWIMSEKQPLDKGLSDRR